MADKNESGNMGFEYPETAKIPQVEIKGDREVDKNYAAYYKKNNNQTNNHILIWILIAAVIIIVGIFLIFKL